MRKSENLGNSEVVTFIVVYCFPPQDLSRYSRSRPRLDEQGELRLEEEQEEEEEAQDEEEKNRLV